MSIASRMAPYSLYRAEKTLDDYGVMSATPIKIADIQVSITKNTPTHDNLNPTYDITPYLGITQFVGVALGDILEDSVGTQYQVKDIGNKGSVYLPLFLVKL